jgi:hypothetical protein
MQRYEFVIGDLAPAGQLVPSDGGHYVLYADTLPRTLTADDPEPAVGSVVLDGSGLPWLRIASGWCVVFDFAGPHRWGHVTSEGPVRLIWDGSSE